MKSVIASTLALAAVASAQDMSICDKYTTALLKENNATNQQTLLTLVVNTAVIGNYTKPNVGITVPGILANGTGKYAGVSLLPYFSGGLASTNDGGSMGVSMNFLDGGGAAPLMMNMPANDTTSAQYTLLTHLYQYFGYLLGCSEFANTTMQYAGDTSMYQVHKFMALNSAQVGYFIEQVGMSAASFGVSDADVTTVGTALTKAFDYRCSAAAAIPATAEPALQAICVDADCMLAPNATCAAYSSMIAAPTYATSTATASMSGSSTMASSTSTPAAYTGAGAIPAVSGFAATVLGLLAFLL